MANPLGTLVTPTAFRADGSLHALELDTSDRLRVVVEAVPAAGAIIIPEPSFLAPIGGIASYEDINLPAGTSNHVILQVPAGQRFQIDCYVMWYTGTTSGVSIYPWVARGGVSNYIEELLSFTSGRFRTSYPNIILEGDDWLEITIYGATAGNDINMTVFYRRIK